MATNQVLPTGVTLDCLLDKLRPLCWGAADILLAYARREQPPYGFPSVLEVQEGGDGPVSAADLAVNEWLLDGLKSAFPKENWTLISEETAKNQLVIEQPSHDDWFWILDPLDGTKDFLEGSVNYAVHLALVNCQCPVFGIVLIPELEELWFGALGVGAWRENRISLKSPPVFSKRRSLNELLLVTSKSHRDKRLEMVLEGLPFLPGKRVGSVGCKIATLLRGEADMYISLSGDTAPKDWDMAAPAAVLNAAGGCFTDVNGSNLTYHKENWLQPGCLIASHGFNHSKICEVLTEQITKVDSR